CAEGARHFIAREHLRVHLLTWSAPGRVKVDEDEAALALRPTERGRPRAAPPSHPRGSVVAGGWGGEKREPEDRACDAHPFGVPNRRAPRPVARDDQR